VTRTQQPPPLFTLRTLVILVVSVLFGLAAGWLTYLSTKALPGAVLAAGAAFGGCVVGLHQLVE
jgi:hypothetical protein